MNSRIILLGLAVVAFGSCSTAYKTGQTPDDVYYSPARETAAYVKVENDDDRRYRSEDRYRSNDIYRSNDDYINSDDRWLRMRVRNRYRWSAFDDYQWNDWRYNSWSYNSYNSYSPFNNYWNNYYSWNSYYNPYCTRVILVNPKTNPVVYNRVRDFNLNSYSNNTYSNRNSSPIRSKVMSRGTSNPGYNNNNSTLGNSVRKVFSNSNSSSGTRDTYVSPSSSDRPTRVYQPSSSSSSSSPGTRSSGASSGGSSGSSGSSSGSGSRPSRGN